MAKIEFQKVCKSFGQTKVIENLDLTIEDGKFTVLVGSSGCGKTTLLRMIAGIGPATSGRIFMDGKDITDVPPEKRDIAMVFQNYAIYPTMSVRENIEFGLKNRKVPKAERLERAMDIAKLVHVDTMMKRHPAELSGGQQQRVAIARALVKNPHLLLLDEPLSNLDARLRLEMREEIRRIQQRTGVTTIFVTHDQEEAMSISDRIVLMKLGVLQQNDLPQNLYDQPANQFVADFLGNPPINNLRGVVKGGRFELEDGSASCDCSLCAGAGEGRRVTLALRAESAVVGPEGPLGCEVTSIYQMGKEEMAYLRFGNSEFRAYISVEDGLKRGQKVNVALRGRGVFLFDTETGERIA